MFNHQDYQASIQRLAKNDYEIVSEGDSGIRTPSGDSKVVEGFVDSLLAIVVKMSEELAHSYDGPGSGPMSPQFWIHQYMGRSIDANELISKYGTKARDSSEILYSCNACGKTFVGDIAKDSIIAKSKIPSTFVCSNCRQW